MRYKIKSIYSYAIFGFLSLTCLVISTPATASLLITPLQIVIEGRTRTAEVILVNSSKDTNTYRLLWEQLDQTEGTGGYIPVDDEARKQQLDLEDFAVFTPRQITLGPNEKQTIRVAVRRPADLEDGEYKSHLKFSIIPSLSFKEVQEKKMNDNEIGIGAKVYASYSIPVVYRAGNYDTSIEIGTPDFSVNPKTSNLLIDLLINRSGIHGVIGLIEVFYKENGGTERLIGNLGNASLFSQINTRKFTIVTQEKALNPGQIRIVFKKAEGKLSSYPVLAEKTFPVGN